MDKPDDIPQDVWDEAYGACFQGVWKVVEGVARAILKAKNDAYWEAAELALKYDGRGMEGKTDAHLGDAYQTKIDIHRLIRNLKHEG